MAIRLTVVKQGAQSAGDDGSLPFFNGSWPGNRNDWDGEIGIAFVAKATFAITALGRHADQQLAAPTRVTLWSAVTREAMASVVVGPQSPLENAYAYEALPQRITLRPGCEYRLSQQCAGGMPDLWYDGRAEDESNWEARYATFVGSAFNFHGGYPSFDDGERRRAGMVNFKIAPEVLTVDFDHAALVLRVKQRLEEETGVPPMQQVLWHEDRCLADDKVSLADAGLEDRDLLTLTTRQGALVATASADSTARLWSTETGASLRAFTSHGAAVTSVEFSSDSVYVLTLAEDGLARLWTLDGNGPCAKLDAHRERIRSALFSPNGFYVLTVSDDCTARLWDVYTRAGGLVPCVCVLKEHSRAVVAGSFSLDSGFVVTASHDGTARMWNIPHGDRLQVFAGHSGSVLDATISPDGAHVLTRAIDAEAPVRIWSVETGACLHSLCGGLQALTVAFSPHGDTVATACTDHAVHLWCAEDGAHLHCCKHDVQVVSASFSCDGAMLVARCADDTARLWDLRTRESVLTVPKQGAALLSVGFSPCGTLLAASYADGKARLWDAVSGACRQVLSGHTKPVLATAISP